jgi:hypothetical protein
MNTKLWIGSLLFVPTGCTFHSERAAAHGEKAHREEAGEREEYGEEEEGEEEENEHESREHAPGRAAEEQAREHRTVESTVILGFDQDPVAALPAGWRIQGTNQKGPLATWKVVEDPSAPSSPRALALTATNHESGGTFNLCWTDRERFSDGAIEVSLKPVSGSEDRGGGPIWRVQDANNYYICRANPLESNFRVYYVKDGSRKQLASANAEIASGVWHRIRIEHSGEQITCYLDGKKLLDASDDHLPQSGGVGLWTKADAVTTFDDIHVEHYAAAGTGTGK